MLQGRKDPQVAVVELPVVVVFLCVDDMLFLVPSQLLLSPRCLMPMHLVDCGVRAMHLFLPPSEVSIRTSHRLLRWLVYHLGPDLDSSFVH